MHRCLKIINGNRKVQGYEKAFWCLFFETFIIGKSHRSIHQQPSWSNYTVQIKKNNSDYFGTNISENFNSLDLNRWWCFLYSRIKTHKKTIDQIAVVENTNNF
jgi:hypothetical protein